MNHPDLGVENLLEEVRAILAPLRMEAEDPNGLLDPPVRDQKIRKAFASIMADNLPRLALGVRHGGRAQVDAALMLVRKVLSKEDIKAFETALTTAARALPLPEVQPFRQMEDDHRPVLELHPTRPHANNDRTVELLADHVPLFFRTSYGRFAVVGECEIVRDDTPTLAIVPASELKIGDLMSRHICYTQVKTDVTGNRSQLEVTPPTRIAKEVCGLAGDYRSVRLLNAVSRIPVLRPDGTVADEGYDAATRTLYVPLPGKRVEIPERPTLADAQGWAAELLTLVQEFPFAADADKIGWLALVLTLVGRWTIEDPSNVPLFLIRAPLMGSGKTLLTETAAMIATGRNATKHGYTSNKEELTKAFASVFQAAPLMMLLDNVNDEAIGGEPLDTVLTSGGEWGTRRLGVNEMFRFESIRTVFIATANNATLKGDLERRVLPITLVPATDKAFTGKDYKIDRLERFVRERRHVFASRALGILAGWFAAGKPESVKLPRWGSFEGWDVVRHTLTWLGYDDPYKLREPLDTENLTKVAENAFVHALWNARHATSISDPNGLTAKQITDLAGRIDPLGDALNELIAGRGSTGASRSVGKVLMTMKGRRVRNSVHGGLLWLEATHVPAENLYRYKVNHDPAR